MEPAITNEKVQTLPIEINGKIVEMPTEQIAEMIRQKLKKQKSVLALCDEFEISIDAIDDLVIEFVPLEKKYAETDATSMRLNIELFKEGKFFEDYFFVVGHELVHHLSRVLENQSYMNDPEEVLGFVLSVAVEMENGADLNTVYNRIYPKISWHFHNESDALKFFENLVERAQRFLGK